MGVGVKRGRTNRTYVLCFTLPHRMNGYNLISRTDYAIGIHYPPRVPWVMRFDSAGEGFPLRAMNWNRITEGGSESSLLHRMINNWEEECVVMNSVAAVNSRWEVRHKGRFFYSWSVSAPSIRREHPSCGCSDLNIIWPMFERCCPNQCKSSVSSNCINPLGRSPQQMYLPFHCCLTKKNGGRP